MDEVQISCPCGHMAKAGYREKDNPYSSYGIWSFENLNCIDNTVSKGVQMSLFEAISEASPECPICNEKILIEHCIAI
mgnify:CR=1 FL=1